MNNNRDAHGDNTGEQLNPPLRGGQAPGAAQDPVRDQQEDPLNRDPNFRAQAQRPAGRTAISLVAQRLVANQDATPAWNNERPFVNQVTLHPARLRMVFEGILFPIVYGNYRAIGTRTNNQAADAAILDNIITTISVNATLAAYAVMYNKATALNTGYVAQFGGVPDVDKFRFPALITYLVNSLGPVQRDRDPYRCLFLPTMDKAQVDALRTLAGYDPLLEEMFTTGVLKTRNVLVTDVDVNAKDSSHWWTLHVEREHVPFNVPGEAIRTQNEANPARGTRGHQTVYSPIHFHDRDAAVLIGGLCLVQTLYDLPGPLRTARVGPFVGPDVNDKNSIPAALRDAFGINTHPPAIILRFRNANDGNVPPIDRAVTNAEALVFGQLQADNAIEATADADFVQARARTQNNYNQWLQYDQALQQFLQQQAQAPGPGALVQAGQAGAARPAPPNRPGIFLPGRPGDDAPGGAHLRMRTCEIIYFDHIMYREFPLSRIGSVVTEANRMNTPVSIGDEVFNRN